MIRSSTLLRILPLLPFCGLAAAIAAPAPASQPGVVREEFVFRTAPFPSCHAATLAELPNGDLLCAFFGGTAERNPDVEIRLARQPAGGTWTAPVSVADGVQPDGKRLPTWNPVLFQPRHGDLMLFYKVGPSPSRWWGMLKTSPDGGHTWGAARRLGEGLIGPVKNKPLELRDDTLLSGSSTEDHGRHIQFERSPDGGRTWRLIGPIAAEDQIQAIQPTLLTYADGRIQALCRTGSKNGFIAQTWSKDGGETWSPLKPLGLPNNDSGFDGVTLRDGRQLLVYNHSTRNEKGMGHKGRGILNVALSRDGETWAAALVLDYSDRSDVQYSYPAVIQTRDGLVHIAYTWKRQRIKHVVLDPARLQATPMPDGKWPQEGPASIAALRRYQAAHPDAE